MNVEERKTSKALLKINNKSYFDSGPIIKALFLAGAVLLIAFILLYLGSSLLKDDGSWEGKWVGNVNSFFCALPISIILFIIGGILYIFHRGFQNLGQFAAEVESGEFEKKAIAELREEDEKKRGEVENRR